MIGVEEEERAGRERREKGRAQWTASEIRKCRDRGDSEWETNEESADPLDWNRGTMYPGKRMLTC